MTGVEAVPAISLWQPWAGAVACGLKREETRSHARLRCLVGQVVAIHAALKWTDAEREAWQRVAAMSDGRMPALRGDHAFPSLGAVVAVVEFLDAQEMTPDLIAAQTPLELALGDWRPGRWAYQLGRVRRLPEPVPVTGRQGPFKVTHPGVAAAARALREQADDAASEPNCAVCCDQGHLCDWCSEPPGACVCGDDLDRDDIDDEIAADRWTPCISCPTAKERA